MLNPARMCCKMQTLDVTDMPFGEIYCEAFMAGPETQFSDNKVARRL